MAAKKKAPAKPRGPGNPKQSKWYATRAEDRKRPKVQYTLDPAMVEDLKAYVEAHGTTQSDVVEAAVLAYLDRHDAKGGR